MSPELDPSLSVARMRGCSFGREHALRQVFGESSPPGGGFDFAAAPADRPEVGPLRLLRFDGRPDASRGKVAKGTAPAQSQDRDVTTHWVTSGLSDPGRGDLPRDRQADERFSGLGIELVLACRGDAEFAAPALAESAMQIAEQDQPAMTGDLIELSRPVFVPETAEVAPLTHLIVVDGGPYRSRVVLPTGHAVLLHLIGLFEAEADALWGLGNRERVKRILNAPGPTRVTRPERMLHEFAL